ncbi:unnamed protein product [Orchesella dallaii]|uniref:Uncharacterized protein n=1 Tax=Orchesella dallaii TaxID=48710 RepID=A0ABP1QFF0_9HEXA
MIRRQDTRITFPWIGFNVGEIGKTFLVLLLVTLAIIFAAGEEEDVFNHPFYYSNYTSSTNEIVSSVYDILPHGRDKYDKFTNPNNNGTPTDVHFHVTVLNIDNINEDLMSYEVDMLLIKKWKDERLRAGTGNRGKDYIELDIYWSLHLWRPNWLIKNTNMAGMHHFLRLYNDKTVMYVAKLRVALFCPMKFERYPHDTQFCTMEIQSLSQSTKDLVFKWDDSNPLVIDSNLNLPQFNIVTSIVENCTLEYSFGNCTCLKVIFELRRKTGYHVFRTYIPSALLVVFSWISFWIRPEAAAERITVCVTSLLILATQNVVQSLVIFPKVPCIKYIDVWMGFCTAFAIVALLEFALVTHFIEKGYRAENNSCKDIYELDTNADAQSQTQPFAGSTLKRKSNRKRNMSLKLDKISRVLFPIAFLIFNIVYWSIVLI